MSLARKRAPCAWWKEKSRGSWAADRIVHIEKSAWAISTDSAAITIRYGSQSPRLSGLRRNAEYARIPIVAIRTSRISEGDCALPLSAEREGRAGSVTSVAGDRRDRN